MTPSPTPARDAVEEALKTLEQLANLPCADMKVWDAHANAVQSLAAEVTALRAEVEGLKETHDAVVDRLDHRESALTAANARIREMEARVNSPIVDDFIDGVTNEAAHQIERWGASHDAGKEPQDWFWLLGWLAGKAVKAASSGDFVKAKHHTISSAAALLNWHRALSSDHNEMRPGIDPAAKGYEPLPAPKADAQGGR